METNSGIIICVMNLLRLRNNYMCDEFVKLFSFYWFIIYSFSIMTFFIFSSDSSSAGGFIFIFLAFLVFFILTRNEYKKVRDKAIWLWRIKKHEHILPKLEFNFETEYRRDYLYKFACKHNLQNKSLEELIILVKLMDDPLLDEYGYGVSLRGKYLP